MNNPGFRIFPPFINTASIFLLILIPTVLLLVFSRHHIWDFKIYYRWSTSWSEGPKNVYQSGFLAKYPIGGVVLTAGAISAIRKILPGRSVEEVCRVFKAYLTVYDILSAFCLALILHLVGIPAPFFFSLLIFCLPSTWAGAALWGQIDNITQLFIRLSAAGFIINLKNIWSPPNCRTSPGDGYFPVAYTLGVMGLVCGILTKQTFIFSIPGLLVFWFTATSAILLRYGKSIRPVLLMVNLFAVLCLLIPEIFIRFPERSIHHLLYIFREPLNPYGNKISGNGFNVWMFLMRPMDSPADIPICLGISPRQAGYFLYLVFSGFLWLRLLRPVSRYLRQMSSGIRGWDGPGFTSALILIAIGIGNLSFNVLLTGTHDRYLYHTYPFLITGFLYLWKSGLMVNGKDIICLISAAVLYGGFIYARLDNNLNPLLQPYHIHLLLAAVHLSLLIWLSCKWVVFTKYNPSRGNDVPRSLRVSCLSGPELPGEIVTPGEIVIEKTKSGT